METSKHHIEPAAGRLGVLTVGLGAVASTAVAGVELISKPYRREQLAAKVRRVLDSARGAPRQAAEI